MTLQTPLNRNITPNLKDNGLNRVNPHLTTKRAKIGFGMVLNKKGFIGFLLNPIFLWIVGIVTLFIFVMFNIHKFYYEVNLLSKSELPFFDNIKPIGLDVQYTKANLMFCNEKKVLIWDSYTCQGFNKENICYQVNGEHNPNVHFFKLFKLFNPLYF